MLKTTWKQFCKLTGKYAGIFALILDAVIPIIFFLELYGTMWSIDMVRWYTDSHAIAQWVGGLLSFLLLFLFIVILIISLESVHKLLRALKKHDGLDFERFVFENYVWKYRIISFLETQANPLFKKLIEWLSESIVNVFGLVLAGGTIVILLYHYTPSFISGNLQRILIDFSTVNLLKELGWVYNDLNKKVDLLAFFFFPLLAFLSLKNLQILGKSLMALMRKPGYVILILLIWIFGALVLSQRYSLPDNAEPFIFITEALITLTVGSVVTSVILNKKIPNGNIFQFIKDARLQNWIKEEIKSGKSAKDIFDNYKTRTRAATEERIIPYIIDTPVVFESKNYIQRNTNIVNGVFRYISHVRYSRKNISQSVVIGIEGSRGSGKTSITNLLKSTILDLLKDTYVYFDFNAWAYRRGELTIHLLEELKSIIESRRGSKMMDRYINMLSEAHSSLKFLSAFKSNRNSISEMIQEISRELQNHEDRTIIVFIDDLDRICNPKELNEVLAILRSSANFPNLIYIINYSMQNFGSSGAKEDQRGEIERLTSDFEEKFVNQIFRVENFSRENIIAGVMADQNDTINFIKEKLNGDGISASFKNQVIHQHKKELERLCESASQEKIFEKIDEYINVFVFDTLIKSSAPEFSPRSITQFINLNVIDFLYRNDFKDFLEDFERFIKSQQKKSV